MTLIFKKTYDVQAIWGPRAETPDALAVRFCKLVDALHDINPLLQNWVFGARSFEDLRPRMAKFIASNIVKDDFGEPDPVDGYIFGVYTKGQPAPLTYDLQARAGATSKSISNRAALQTKTGYIPAPEAITYEIFQPALLAMVDAWAPEVCFAFPAELLDHIDLSTDFRESWMLYLGPHLAPFVTPPETSINEHLADGGLLMSATTETFRIDNPHHMAVARDIKAAVAHLRDRAGTVR